MSDAPIPREGLLSLSEVMRLTTLGQSEIYARMAAGTFPVSRQVGLRKVAWLAAEVLDWIAALPPKRAPAAPSVASEAASSLAAPPLRAKPKRKPGINPGIHVDTTSK